MSLRVDYGERAISQAAAFLDDPQGIRHVLDAIEQLADDPRPGRRPSCEPVSVRAETERDHPAPPPRTGLVMSAVPAARPAIEVNTVFAVATA